MNNTNTTLQQLRDLAHGAPSKSNWKLVCQALDTIEGEDLELALSYAMEHTASWHANTRAAPANWIDDLLDPQKSQPRAQLVTSISARRRPISRKSFAALCASPHLKRLEKLELRECSLGPWAGKLLAGASMPALKTLDLHFNELEESAVELINSPLAAQLTHLNLCFNGNGEELNHALAKTTNLEKLEKLEIDAASYYGIADDLAWVADNKHLKRSVRDSVKRLSGEARYWEESEG